jgi:hypothetical protein
VKRYASGIIKAYRGMGILMGLSENTDPMSVAMDYCDTVNSNIRVFLKDKSKKMNFQLERGKVDFAHFCSWIDAEVDIEAAQGEFDIKYNASFSKV